MIRALLHRFARWILADIEPVPVVPVALPDIESWDRPVGQPVPFEEEDPVPGRVQDAIRLRWGAGVGAAVTRRTVARMAASGVSEDELIRRIQEHGEIIV